MPRTLSVGVLIVLTGILAIAGEPIAPTRVTIEDHPRTLAETMAFLTRQSGIAIDVSKVDGKPVLSLAREAPQPFWQALETVCQSAEVHLSLIDQGRTLQLLSGRAKGRSSVDGAFRVVVTGVTARREPEAKESVYDVGLLINWEPRFPVFRIDTVPTITAATDDRGTKLTTATAKTKSPISEAYAFATVVRLDGLTRDAKTIAKLEGHFTVTASPKLLAFTFDDLQKLPAEKTESNVTVSLTKLSPDDVELKLQYPEGHPEFESFESWADGNKLKLLAPDRTKSYTPASFSTSGNGRKLIAEYHFLKLPLADRSGWSLIYETPAPLTEFTVTFALKDIPLP